MAGQIMAYCADNGVDFRGLSTPPVAIGMVLNAIENASIEGGQAGEHISHKGNKIWL